MENKKLAILLVAKFPREGRSKTRLQPQLSKEFSLQFARNCILDLIEKFSGFGDLAKFILFAPAEDETPFRDWLIQHNACGWTLCPSEKGNSLGELLRDGVKQVKETLQQEVALAFIGMDQPHINEKQVIIALKESASNPKVAILFPVSDGGYSFLCFCPQEGKDTFSNVEWSTERTLSTQKFSLESMEYQVVLREEGFDVDEARDVERLRTLLATNEESFCCPRVSRQLREN